MKRHLIAFAALAGLIAYSYVALAYLPGWLGLDPERLRRAPDIWLAMSWAALAGLIFVYRLLYEWAGQFRPAASTSPTPAQEGKT